MVSSMCQYFIYIRVTMLWQECQWSLQMLESFWVISMCGSQYDANQVRGLIESGHDRCRVFQQLSQKFLPSQLFVPTLTLKTNHKEQVGTQTRVAGVVRPRWNMSSCLPSSGDQYAAEPLDNDWEGLMALFLKICFSCKRDSLLFPKAGNLCDPLWRFFFL